MQQEEEPRGNCVEQPALCHEHGQRNAFPRDLLRLVIGELEFLKKLVAGESAIEEKTGDPKHAAPAVETVEGRERTEQPRPDERADQVDVLQKKERIEKVDPGGITQGAENEDRVVGPERDAVGEILDVSDVQREIAEIVRRLNPEVVAIHVKQPAEGAHGEEGEDNPDGPRPQVVVGARRNDDRRFRQFHPAPSPL